jgi:hypothetical protein
VYAWDVTGFGRAVANPTGFRLRLIEVGSVVRTTLQIHVSNPSPDEILEGEMSLAPPESATDDED